MTESPDILARWPQNHNSKICNYKNEKKKKKGNFGQTLRELCALRRHFLA